MNTKVKVTSTIFVGVLAVLLLQNSGRKSGYSVEHRRNHFFSSQDHKDIFIISAKGENILDALVSFRIISWQGNEIYCDTFSMNDLMERGPDDPRKSHDSLSILSTLSHFFDEDRFDRTYKSLQDVINEDYWGLSPEWQEFRDDTLAIGFTYQLGAEDGKSIAFSKNNEGSCHLLPMLLSLSLSGALRIARPTTTPTQSWAVVKPHKEIRCARSMPP